MCGMRRSNRLTLLCAIGVAVGLIGLPGACGGGGGGNGGGGVAAPEFLPDPTFGSGGLVTGQGSLPNSFYEWADVGAGGAMAILGKTQSGVSTFGTLLVEKRLADGSPDAAFGAGGQVEVTDLPGYTAKGVALGDLDGSVLVVADRGLDGYSLLKFAANGSPDASFGAGGSLHVATAQSIKIAGMVVDGDGKIVVAGSTDGGGYVMRHLASGAPDPAWNGGSPYTFQILGFNTRIEDLVPRTGGGYLLAGTRAASSGPNLIIVGRFNTSGGPIPGYGSGGFLMYTPSVGSDVDGLVPRPDGACATYGTTSPDHAFALGVNPDGDVVRVFGYRELGAPLVSHGLRGAHPRSSGALLFGFMAQGSRDVILWQTLVNGGSDASFGDGGVSTIPMDEDTFIRTLVRRPDGGILLLGDRLVGSNHEGVAMSFVPTAP